MKPALQRTRCRLQGHRLGATPGHLVLRSFHHMLQYVTCSFSNECLPHQTSVLRQSNLARSIPPLWNINIHLVYIGSMEVTGWLYRDLPLRHCLQSQKTLWTFEQCWEEDYGTSEVGTKYNFVSSTNPLWQCYWKIEPLWRVVRSWESSSHKWGYYTYKKDSWELMPPTVRWKHSKKSMKK